MRYLDIKAQLEKVTSMTPLEQYASKFRNFYKYRLKVGTKRVANVTNRKVN